MTGGGSRGSHEEGAGVLPLERGPELAADGDDIIVIRSGPPPRPRGRRIAIAVLAAIVVLATAGAVVALTDDEDPKNNVKVSGPAPTSARPTETTGAPRPTVSVAPTSVVATVPVLQLTVPAPTAAPALTTPTPPPTAHIVAPEISLDPAHATVSAGTPVVVTLRVHNGSADAVTVPYDNDGCDPALVLPIDIGCTQAFRQLNVDAGADGSVAITISTDNASPGDYDIAIGDRTVRVTIV